MVYMAAESRSVSSAAIESWIDNIVEQNDTTAGDCQPQPSGHIIPPTPISNTFESEEPRGRRRRRTLCDINFHMPNGKISTRLPVICHCWLMTISPSLRPRLQGESSPGIGHKAHAGAQ